MFNNVFPKIVPFIKTQILCSITFFSENRAVYQNTDFMFNNVFPKIVLFIKTEILYSITFFRKSCRLSKKTDFMFNNVFSENRAVYQNRFYVQ